MRKLPYKEGDVFVFPLGTGRYSVGVIARSTRRGRVLLGYFFRDTFPAIPEAAQIPTLLPQNALKVLRFGDLSLMTGEWPVVDHIKNWERNDWPMPKFLHRAPIGKFAQLVSYADHDPNEVTKEERCEFETTGYEEDGLFGAGAVEILFTRLLGSSDADHDGNKAR